jgi:hypothetical protein
VVAAREPQPKPDRQPAPRTRQERQPRQPDKKAEQADRIAPRNGVEIVEVTEQDGVPHYAMRDLRNNQITRNVTSATARSLWAQAIREYERGTPSEESITWAGDFGLWKSVRISNGERRFHLVARTPDGTLRYFFGVSEDAMDERWLEALNAAREPAMAEAQPRS